MVPQRPELGRRADHPYYTMRLMEVAWMTVPAGQRPGVLARPKGFEPPTLGSEDRCSVR